MPEDAAPDQGRPLDTDKLTWTVLLGNWIEFARSALVLPDDDAGRAMRDSVVDIITLQAVWFALQHLDELDEDEKALGLARAEVLIERHAGAVTERWRDGQMPEELSMLIADAMDALVKSRTQ
jgi:hypothetical protein